MGLQYVGELINSQFTIHKRLRRKTTKASHTRRARRHRHGDCGSSVGDVDVPDIYGAVQEQLGLKLEKARGMVDILTIDTVHELVEN